MLIYDQMVFAAEVATIVGRLSARVFAYWYSRPIALFCLFDDVSCGFF